MLRHQSTDKRSSGRPRTRGSRRCSRGAKHITQFRIEPFTVNPGDEGEVIQAPSVNGASVRSRSDAVAIFVASPSTNWQCKSIRLRCTSGGRTPFYGTSFLAFADNPRGKTQDLHGRVQRLKGISRRPYGIPPGSVQAPHTYFEGAAPPFFQRFYVCQSKVRQPQRNRAPVAFVDSLGDEVYVRKLAHSCTHVAPCHPHPFGHCGQSNARMALHYPQDLMLSWCEGDEFNVGVGSERQEHVYVMEDGGEPPEGFVFAHMAIVIYIKPYEKMP